LAEPRILLAHGSETIRSLLSYLLSSAGYAVEEAEDGVSALRSAYANPPDLAIAGTRLPGVNGIQLCRTMKGAEGVPGVPVLLLTSHEGGGERSHALRAGADRLILVDLSPEAILQAVEEVLAEAQMRAPRAPAVPAATPPEDVEVVKRVNRTLEGLLFEATLFNEIAGVGQDVDDFEMILRSLDRLLLEIVPHAALAAVFTDGIRQECVAVYPAPMSDRAREAVRGYVERVREETATVGVSGDAPWSEVLLEGEDAAVAEVGRLVPTFVCPIRSGEMVKGVILTLSGESDHAATDRKLAEAVLRQSFIVLENAWLYRQITRISTTDGLTGLTNVRAFREIHAREHSRAARHRLRYSLLMVDIDHFKKINDVYGHPVGDTVLRELAALFREFFRNTDFPARYGGEEFIVLLPDTGKTDAHLVSERLRAAVERRVFAAPSPSLRATISVGLVEFDPDAVVSEKEIIARADACLYAAKREGRNRVVVR
jgi:diguanylate cyclase (GGDEF)-like protein